MRELGERIIGVLAPTEIPSTKQKNWLGRVRGWWRGRPTTKETEV